MLVTTAGAGMVMRAKDWGWAWGWCEISVRFGMRRRWEEEAGEEERE